MDWARVNERAMQSERQQ